MILRMQYTFKVSQTYNLSINSLKNKCGYISEKFDKMLHYRK